MAKHLIVVDDAKDWPREEPEGTVLHFRDYLLGSAGSSASRIVNLCHKRGMRIHPYIGPSSILLALSASGLHGQAFTFHGYAPVKTEDLQEHFQGLNKSKHQAHSHLFIEAPYRSDRFLEMATKHLDGDWYLSVSSDLQGENERIQTRRLSEWKNHLNSLGKTPCLFVLGQPSQR